MGNVIMCTVKKISKLESEIKKIAPERFQFIYVFIYSCITDTSRGLEPM